MHFAPHGFGGRIGASHFGAAAASAPGRLRFAARLVPAISRVTAASPITASAATRSATPTSRRSSGGALRRGRPPRLGDAAVGANWAHHHGWYGWRGYRRGYVGWGGPVFWPYAYDDLFDYAFWPYGPYDDLFWSYGYDDLVRRRPAAFRLRRASMAVTVIRCAPAGAYGGAAVRRRSIGRRARRPTSASQLCVSAQSLAGGAAIDPIAKAVQSDGRPERQARRAEERRSRRRKDARRFLRRCRRRRPRSHGSTPFRRGCRR